jgi:hypothetical protein
MTGRIGGDDGDDDDDGGDGPANSSRYCNEEKFYYCIRLTYYTYYY